MATYSKELLEKTIDAWQPSSQEPLTMEDAREIVQNTVGFYSLLMKWEKEANEKSSKTKEQN